MISYLFIDAGCLREQLKAMADTYQAGAPLNVDYERFTSGYPEGRPSKIFYYDALPAKRAKEDDAAYRSRFEEAKQQLDALHSLNGFHVFEGDVRRSTARRNNEQKKIDVAIAVDMLTHSFRKNMQHAILLTSDLDFKPLIDALVQDGMIVSLWHPKRNTPKELIAAADRSVPLHIGDVYSAIIEPRFELPRGASAPDVGEVGAVLFRWNHKGQRARLEQVTGSFRLVVRWIGQSNATEFAHPSLEILRAYASDVHGIIIPEGSPDTETCGLE